MPPTKSGTKRCVMLGALNIVMTFERGIPDIVASI